MIAYAKFKELSPILAARGASYHIQGKMYRVYVLSVLTNGTETWAMKAENLLSLESIERMMVEWKLTFSKMNDELVMMMNKSLGRCECTEN